MKNSSIYFLKLSGIVLSTTILLIACGSSKEEKAYQEAYAKASADSVSSSPTQSQSEPKKSLSTPVKKDSLRAFFHILHFKK